MGKFTDKIKKILRRENGKAAQLRSIIHEYYGDNIGWFAFNYASNIYSIPEVRTAIEAFADIFSTIPRYFERRDKNGYIQYFEHAADKVINLKPNPLQNATQFWKNVITSLFLHSNVFIEPTFDYRTGELKYLYVLPKDKFDFNLYNDRATVTFLTLGKTYDMDSLIYLNRFSTLGGGQSNDLGLYETVIQALAQQAIEVASPKKPRAFLQGKSNQQGNLKDKDKKGTMEDVKANFDSSVRGLVYLDPQWDVTPINWTENDVNRDLMKFVINIVDNYFGITEEIINNKATEIEYQLFVKNKIEPLAKQIEQEFTAKLFSKREREFGNRLEFDTFHLSVSTLSAKTQFFNVVGRSGVLNIDEQREMIGYPPLPDGLGQMYRVTADTVNIEIADEYQKAKNGKAMSSDADKAPVPTVADPKGGKDENTE
ncbi:MAG: phage portal protein [Clostridia bacterium]|nr:phage portal protein [Clostridia bacterium]